MADNKEKDLKEKKQPGIEKMTREVALTVIKGLTVHDKFAITKRIPHDAEFTLPVWRQKFSKMLNKNFKSEE